MGIILVLGLVAAYCAIAFYRASGGEFTPQEEIDSATIMLWHGAWGKAVAVSWPIFLVAHLFMIAWTYRCHRNLESLGHRELDSKHIWALLCWIVPVLNLALITKPSISPAFTCRCMESHWCPGSWPQQVVGAWKGATQLVWLLEVGF